MPSSGSLIRSDGGFSDAAKFTPKEVVRRKSGALRTFERADLPGVFVSIDDLTDDLESALQHSLREHRNFLRAGPRGYS
jgi:hypothetical protein